MRNHYPSKVIPETPNDERSVLYRQQSNAGPETMARFEFQHECLALRIIRNLNGGSLTSVVAEWSSDYALLDETDKQIEFVSVKHREGSRPPWTLPQLLSEKVLRDLYRIWRGMQRRGQFTLETSGGADTRLTAFLKAPRASRWDSEIHHVADAIEASIDDATAFLAVFRMSELPQRKDITDKAVRELGAVLASWGLDARAADACYERLLARIAAAATDRPLTPQERLHRLEGFTATVFDRLENLTQADRTITFDEVRNLLRVEHSKALPGLRLSESRGDRTILGSGVFIGRQDELHTIMAVLQQRGAQEDPSAFVLITGEPGIGKTSLARRAIAATEAFTSGPFVLSSSTFTTGQEILDALLEIVAPSGGLVPDSPGERVARLRHLIAGMGLVVLLDDIRSENCLREFIALGLDIALVCTR